MSGLKAYQFGLVDKHIGHSTSKASLNVQPATVKIHSSSQNPISELTIYVYKLNSKCTVKKEKTTCEERINS